MKHGLKGPFVKLTFVQTTFGNLEKRLPDLGMTGYKNRALSERRTISAI